MLLALSTSLILPGAQHVYGLFLFLDQKTYFLGTVNFFQHLCCTQTGQIPGVKDVHTL